MNRGTGSVAGLVNDLLSAPAVGLGPLRARLPRSAGDPLGPVEQDPDDVRDIACDLTATGEVCSPPEPEPFVPTPSPSGGGSGGAGSGLGSLLVVALVVALLLAIGWLVLTVVRNRGAVDEPDEDDDVDVDLDAPVGRRVVDHERPPDLWRDAAAEHRSAGRFRDAVRCEYRALVGDLARAGFVDEIPGRTSGEERVQLAALAPAVAADFDAAADRFDEAWFSELPVDREDDAAFVAASRRVLDAVLASAGPRPTRLRGAATRSDR